MWGIEAEQDEVIVNSFCSPQSVFTTQPAYEQPHFLVNRWPSAFPRLPTPEESEASPVPLDDGNRLHQVNGFSPVRPESIEKCPEEPEGWCESWLWLFLLVDAVFQHGQLAFGSEEPCRKPRSWVCQGSDECPRIPVRLMNSPKGIEAVRN